jgi:hypothetical protein
MRNGRMHGLALCYVRDSAVLGLIDINFCELFMRPLLFFAHGSGVLFRLFICRSLPKDF